MNFRPASVARFARRPRPGIALVSCRLLVLGVLIAVTAGPAFAQRSGTTESGGQAASAAPGPVDSAATAPGGAPIQGAQPGASPAGGFGQLIIPLMLGLMLFMIVMSIFGTRKQKKQRQEMLSALGKQDRVQMLGGEIGVVVELKDNELVIDSAGSRIRFNKSAVQQVLTRNEEPAEVPAEGLRAS